MDTATAQATPLMTGADYRESLRRLSLIHI